MSRKPAFISHSAEREAQIQGRMFVVLERRFSRRITAELITASENLLTGYRAVGYVPAMSDDDIAAIRWAYLDLARGSAKTFASRIVTQGKSLGHDLETKDMSLVDFFAALAQSWINLEPIRRRIQAVSETTRLRIVRIVERGQIGGLTVDDIAKQIAEEVPAISRIRGALIARTETHGAANYAMHETAKQTGLDLEKEWVSVEDHRTRRIGMDDEFDHMSMTGQKRPMDEPFHMPMRSGGVLPIMYPGEAGKPGGAVINCRCVAVHAVIGLD